jgi:hypothetical protein
MDDAFASAENNFIRDRQAWETANRERYNSGSFSTRNMGMSDELGQSSSFYSTNPAENRLASSGLFPGGVVNNNLYNPSSLSVQFVNADQPSRSNDWKVRISLAPSLNWFNSGIMRPLAEHHGVIFPYTPEITVSHLANYVPMRFTHSNYTQAAYENSEISSIQISGDFTAQTKYEADYVLACIYFFRSVTKMFFGQDTGTVKAGNPPPLVYLNGYGESIFKNTPCVVSQFQHTMPGDIDYIETANTGQSSDDGFLTTDRSGTSTRIPTATKLTVVLTPIYSKRNISGFNLEEFAQGRLISRGFI